MHPEHTTITPFQCRDMYLVAAMLIAGYGLPDVGLTESKNAVVFTYRHPTPDFYNAVSDYYNSIMLVHPKQFANNIKFVKGLIGTTRAAAGV